MYDDSIRLYYIQRQGKQKNETIFGMCLVEQQPFCFFARILKVLKNDEYALKLSQFLIGTQSNIFEKSSTKTNALKIKKENDRFLKILIITDLGKKNYKTKVYM